MYNMDKTYLKTFQYSPLSEGAVEISQKLSLQILLKKLHLTEPENLANMVCSFQNSSHYSQLLMNKKYSTKFTDQE